MRARTAFAPLLGLGYDVRRGDMDFALMRKFVDEWREVAPNYYGDFYPLTSWTYAHGHMDGLAVRPSRKKAREWSRLSAGRRSYYTAARFKLRGLDPGATYVLKNFDLAGTVEISGRELLDAGAFRGH